MIEQKVEIFSQQIVCFNGPKLENIDMLKHQDSFPFYNRTMCTYTLCIEYYIVPHIGPLEKYKKTPKRLTNKMYSSGDISKKLGIVILHSNFLMRCNLTKYAGM